MSKMRNFAAWIIGILFVFVFNATVLVISAQGSFLDPNAVVQAVDESNLSHEIFELTPNLAQAVSEEQFTPVFKDFIGGLIEYLAGQRDTLPEVSLPNVEFALNAETFPQFDALVQARESIILVTSMLPLFGLIGLILVFILLLMSSSLHGKIEVLQKVFWRAGFSMLVSSGIVYLLLTFGGDSLLADTGQIAALSKFISILLLKFITTAIMIALVFVALGVILFFAKKQFKENSSVVQ